MSKTKRTTLCCERKHDCVEQVLPEFGHKMSDGQSLLHLVSAGFTHLLEDVEAFQSHHQFPQQQLTRVVVQHSTQYFLQRLRAGVRLKAVAQIEQPRPLAAVQFLNHLINRLKLIHVRVIDCSRVGWSDNSVTGIPSTFRVFTLSFMKAPTSSWRSQKRKRKGDDARLIPQSLLDKRKRKKPRSL